MAAWELVRQFSGLAYHAGVVYDKQVITIGGNDGTTQVAWILRSHDGRYGDFIAMNPVNLSARERAAACVFDERMWVSGGYNGAGIDHVAFSRDGKEWTDACLIPEHIFNHRMEAFGTPRQKLVILGGYDGTTFYNDIYQTKSDAELEQVSVQGSQWSERSGFGCVVYKNKLWVFGGINTTGSLDDIWWTDDLIHWHRCLEHAPWGKICDFGFCEWDERVWVIGGYNYEYDGGRQGWVTTPSAHVWFSRDMLTWTQAFDFPTTVYHTLAAPIDNRLHVFGGVGNETNVYRMNLG